VKRGEGEESRNFRKITGRIPPSPIRAPSAPRSICRAKCFPIRTRTALTKRETSQP